MAMLEKVWVWPIVMNSVRPFQTKLIGVDQISQFRPNFKILEYLEYMKYLKLGQFRNFCDVFFYKSLSTKPNPTENLMATQHLADRQDARQLNSSAGSFGEIGQAAGG